MLCKNELIIYSLLSIVGKEFCIIYQKWKELCEQGDKMQEVRKLYLFIQSLSYARSKARSTMNTHLRFEHNEIEVL